MRIEKLFKKDIFRPINGVVKADQLDEASVWQELDEFVVTMELDQHFRRFFTKYCEALDNGHDPTVAEKIGVWISGFFGSGKSHFIKVLSYLLANEEHSFGGETKRAVDFFESKITDAMLFGDIKRAVASDTDVILFNIDSKADSNAGRDAILGVFLRVFNEMQGFSGDHPHVAHMERYLAENSKLEEFQGAYQSATGDLWVKERDAYEFSRDQVVEALSSTLGQSKESCEKWIDGAEGNFSLTIENFARWVNEYLDSKGPKHRIIFLVDEVGQFIGSDTHLMLNLQTITEELGTLCKGRAWVVVTSQEDIDAVLGEIQGSKANDFSKIQGRFRTRLSLSSANVDEVIQKRLLAKVDDVVPDLEAVFNEKGDVLRNQLTFTKVGMTFKKIQDADDFVRNYPFAPYQFQLLQKIFESIRKAGATGLHLAQGERSLLDAFQAAGQAVASEEIGVLVPLYRFYPSIESFLDTGVKRTIDQARGNDSLEPFDAHVLEVLFLIRYVDEMKGTVDNLVTLCLDEIDADRLALRRSIEESLQRLEKETLISRSGDIYFFLTNEERDINREIKGVDLSSGEEAKLLGEMIFDDVLKGQRKHRYVTNGMDFSFNRLCDQHPVGSKLEGALVVSVITPLADEYELYNDSRCILESDQDGGQVVIKLGDNASLGRELRTYLKTEKYLRTKDDGTLPSSTKKVHRDLAEDNRERRTRIEHLLGDMLTGAGYFAAGQRLELKANAPVASLNEALEYLVTNTFTKMAYLENLQENPLKEIQAILRSDDVAESLLDMELPENNPKAIEDLRTYIELCTRTSKQIVLYDMINTRYGNRPYGWPPMEVVLLLARLSVAGEIQFISGGDVVARDKVYDAITTQSMWRKVTVLQRISSDPKDVKEARKLGKDVFSEMGPDGEDALVDFLRAKADGWRTSLLQFKSFADLGTYPGKQEIDEGLSTLKALLATKESKAFIERFNSLKNDLLDLADSYHDLENFYQHQRPTWEKLRAASEKFELNRMELERDEDARTALRRMGEILSAPSPYGLIKETDALIRTVESLNDKLLGASRGETTKVIDAQVALIENDLKSAKGDQALRDACLGPLNELKAKVSSQQSLAHLEQARVVAVHHKDDALKKINEWLSKKEKPGPDGPKIRKSRVVKASAFVNGAAYLESKDDVDRFLGALRKELEDAIASDERIEIR